MTTFIGSLPIVGFLSMVMAASPVKSRGLSSRCCRTRFSRDSNTDLGVDISTKICAEERGDERAANFAGS